MSYEVQIQLLPGEYVVLSSGGGFILTNFRMIKGSSPTDCASCFLEDISLAKIETHWAVWYFVVGGLLTLIGLTMLDRSMRLAIVNWLTLDQLTPAALVWIANGAYAVCRFFPWTGIILLILAFAFSCRRLVFGTPAGELAFEWSILFAPKEALRLLTSYNEARHYLNCLQRAAHQPVSGGN